MSTQEGAPESGPTPPLDFGAVPHLPELDRAMSPGIQVADRAIRATLQDAQGHDLVLTFKPYQAARLVTVDCYRAPEGLGHRPRSIHWARSSAWLDELRERLAELDPGADFMERAIHFLVPAGDDVLEVVAWQVEVTHMGRTRRFGRGN